MATQVIRTPGEPDFSWAAVIAGTFTALAVMIVLMTAGASVGLLTASSFSPSASVVRGAAIGAALWLWFAHAMSFIAGGYVAGRLGATWEKATQNESNFRDGMHGFVVWALAAVISTSAAVGLGAAGIAGLTTAGVHGAASGISSSATSGRTDYMIDSLLRPSGNAPNAAPADPQTERAELSRIFTYGLVRGELTQPDKDYAVRVIANRTGMSPQDAQAKLDQAQQTAKQAAQSAARATAFASIWFLLALLFGALGGIFGGMWGGDDREGRESLPVSFGYRRH